MHITPKLIAVDTPIEMKDKLIRIFKPEKDTILKPMCNIKLNVPAMRNFPAFTFDPKLLKEVEGVLIYQCIFEDEPSDINCYIKIRTLNKIMRMDSLLFSACAKSSIKLIRVKLIDVEPENDTDRSIVTFTRPENGAIEIDNECDITLLYNKLGEFRFNFMLEKSYKYDHSSDMHNSYIFENGINDKSSIQITITVKYINDKLHLSSVRFTKLT
jgi:hypothetical protein